MKSPFISVRAGVVALATLALAVMVIISPSGVSAASLFSDGFESNSFVNWTSSNGIWDVNNSGASHLGSFKADAKGDSGSTPDILQKNVSTVGYNAVTLSYWYKIAAGLETHDNHTDKVYVEWSTDGTNWNVLKTYQELNTTQNFQQETFNLPAGASNNAGFRFRFRADLDSNGDDFALDDVSLSASTINTAPTASNVATSTPEDTAKQVTLVATDAEGNPITYTITSSPTHGTLGSVSGNKVTYTPALNYNGPDSFTFTAGDGLATSSPATVSITVTPVNDAPVASNGSASTDENTPVALTLVASDVDLDPLTFSIVAAPLHGLLSAITGNAVTYTPTTGYDGADSFTFKANDGSLDSNTATFSLTVNPKAACEDGIDNDDDGKVDMQDPGCSSASDNDETDPIVDVCSNIAGAQATVPEGYTQNQDGTCSPVEVPVDVCSNIEGNQATIPEGYESLTPGQCTLIVTPPTDVCTNLEGDQATVPQGYTADGTTCTLKQCIAVSDTETLADGNPSSILSFIHSAWATIAGASWIWGSNPVADPTVDTTQVFTKTVTLDSTPLSASIELAADNGYTLKVNGVVVDDQIATETNYNPTHVIPVTNLVAGSNTIEVTVKNFGIPESTADQNPAGLIFKLTTNGANCGEPTPPPPTDVCANIAGEQTNVPAGYFKDGDACYTSSGGGSSTIVYTSPADPTPTVLGASTSTPQVLGESCGLYMEKHLRFGSKKNDKDQATKLQEFLNKHMNAGLPVTGYFGTLSSAAVKKFQAKYADDILKPWGIAAPTGLVYFTTLHKINEIECPEAAGEHPTNLILWSKNPNAQ